MVVTLRSAVFRNRPGEIGVIGLGGADVSLNAIDVHGVGLAAIWLAGRLKLPTRWLHRVVYGKAAAGIRIGRGSYVLARRLRLGRNVRIGKVCNIVADTLTIEDGVTIGDRVCIRCKTVSLGRKSRIDSDVTIRGQVTPRSAFELGAAGWIYSHCYLNPDDRLTIGDRTALGSHCLIFTHSSYLPVTHGYPVRFAPVSIGSDVWLPWHAFVLPGAVIGDGATVGAFSMVGGTVPPNSLAVGVPAKVVKESTSFRRRYDDTGIRRLGAEMLRDAIERWERAFRTRDVFARPTRSVRELSANHWELTDAQGTTSVRLVTGDDDRESTRGDSLVVTIGRLTPPPEGEAWLDLQTLQSRGLEGASRRVTALVNILSQFGLRFDWLPAESVSSRLAIDSPAP
jgi:acetyltransferase-like isoleucine patch superfamily enzyme